MRVKTLKDDDIVYIDSIHGWHYHRKECWMAGSSAVKYKDMKEMKGALGGPYTLCLCDGIFGR